MSGAHPFDVDPAGVDTSRSSATSVATFALTARSSRYGVSGVASRFNPLKGTIEVVEILTEVAGHLEFGPPKTKASRRQVSLPSFLNGLLREQTEVQGSGPNDLVFVGRDGGPLRRTNFRKRQWIPSLKRAGLPTEVRFHDLRHTCAALLIAQGAHPKEIQARLGHSSITTTLDRYGHLFPSLDERLSAGLDELFESAEKTLQHEIRDG